MRAASIQLDQRHTNFEYIFYQTPSSCGSLERHEWGRCAQVVSSPCNPKSPAFFRSDDTIQGGMANAGRPYLLTVYLATRVSCCIYMQYTPPMEFCVPVCVAFRPDRLLGLP